MNRTLTLYLLASLVFVAVSYAGEGPALTQLESIYTGGGHGPVIDPGFSMPEPDPYPQPWGSPWTQWQQPGGSTEDCSMQGGVEVCIAPNWPDCAANGDVEPCIDHVETICPGEAIPTWVSFNRNGRRYQGCFYPSVYYPEAADRALLLRAEEKSLSVLLRGRKIVFTAGAVKKNSSRGYFTGLNSENSCQEFLENDPCHGLMACYNQANNSLLEELLNGPSGNPYAQWPDTDTVIISPAPSPGR
jgi:hypothetical protein